MDNGRTGTGGWTRRALLAAALAGLAWVGTAFGEEAKMTYRWLDPAVADMSGRSTTKPRQRKVDAEKSEALLEEFGREKMPQAYGRYLGLRQKAKEAEGKLQELFPKGMESDPSGGELYAKMREQTRMSVAEMFQRRDEMCVFWLMREAGVFTSEELAKVDKMERMFHLGPEHVEYPEFINAVELVPSEENELFAEKNAPTTLEVFRSLAKLRSEGAASYNQMVRTAKEMDAARVGEDLLVLAERLRDVKARMKKVDEWLGVNRLQAAVEGMSPEVLAAADRQQAGELAEFEKQMQLRPYFFRRARVLPMVDIAELKKGGVRITPIGEVKRLRLPGGAGMEMVWCPPGSFIMGSPAEERGREKFERQHPVRLTRGFWMAKYEVTQAQWQSVMGNNPMENQGDDLPVGNVSWNDCQEFCKKTGLALPTEAQWQFACRAGSTGAYSGTGNLDDMGWYVENSGKQLHPVGKKAPNAWGLYDMHGNVSEWILDKHQRLYFSLGETSMGEMERDPIGDGHDTCCCGGSFLSQEGHCRSSGRMFAESDERYEVLGFRPCLPVFDDMSLPSGNAGKREGKAEAAGDRSSRLSPET